MPPVDPSLVPPGAAPSRSVIGPLARGSTVTITVESLAYGGQGVAHLDGLAVFVESGLPGDRVKARILKKKRSFVEARVVEVETPSPDRIPARCSHFGVCGGCALQHLAYAAQLEAKARQVRELLIHLGGEADPPVFPALGSPEIFGYRNKMEFTFTPRRWRTPEELRRTEKVGPAVGLGPADVRKPIEAIDPAGPGHETDFGFGLHVRNFYEKALNIRECHLPSPETVSIFLRVRDLVDEEGIDVYDPVTGQGLHRFLVLREGRNTGERLANLITSDPSRIEGGRDSIRRIARHLREEFPSLSTFLHGISTRKASVAIGEREEILFGEGTIHEVLNGLRFEIGPNTFFQTNTLQAERLFALVVEEAALTGKETVSDLYSGSGTIALHLARGAKSVIGVESLEEAVGCAVRNARANGISNVRFLAGDLSRVLASGELDRSPDLAVLDPPRSGLHPASLRRLVDMGVPRLVYVSCNPATFARDWKVLRDSGYRLARVRPVDMFPHTAHIELVATIVRA